MSCGDCMARGSSRYSIGKHKKNILHLFRIYLFWKWRILYVFHSSSDGRPAVPIPEDSVDFAPSSHLLPQYLGAQTPFFTASIRPTGRLHNTAYCQAFPECSIWYVSFHSVLVFWVNIGSCAGNAKKSTTTLLVPASSAVSFYICWWSSACCNLTNLIH